MVNKSCFNASLEQCDDRSLFSPNIYNLYVLKLPFEEKNFVLDIETKQNGLNNGLFFKLLPLFILSYIYFRNGQFILRRLLGFDSSFISS